MQPSPAATQSVREWSRAALLVEADDRGRSPVPTMEDSQDLLAAIGRQRVVDLLDKNAAALDLPADVRQQLALTRRETRRTLLVQVLEMGRLQRVLADADVPWLALKGPTLAVQTTGELDARGRGDIDMLVSPVVVERVCELLVAAGWVIRPYGSAIPGTWAWRHAIRSFNEMTFDGPSSTVDLHWRLDPTHHALPDFETLWQRRVTADVGGVVVDTLGLADAFAHTCHHAAKDDWRWLRSLVDIHRLARSPESWRGRALSRVELASLTVTASLLGLPAEMPPRVLEQLPRSSSRVVGRATRAQNRPVFASFPIPGAQSMRDVRYRVIASGAPRDVLHTVGAVVVPASSVSDLDDRTAWTAIPRMLARRARWLARRTTAWIRREPGAALGQSAEQR